MNSFIRPSGYNMLPPVTKNLLIINGIFFLAYYVIGNSFNIDLNKELGLYYMGSEHFRPVQFLTYMFLHGDFTHLFFNMFAFWMFGSTIENVWGPKRFLTFYLITGLGAAIVQQIVGFVRIQAVMEHLTPEMIELIRSEGQEVLRSNKNYVDSAMATYNAVSNTPTVGASGAVYGILLAFGMLFPNALIYLYFAIPVKAKWLVIGYGLIELYSGFANTPGDNVAHFAHLGGMIFGFFMIRYWRKQDINNRRWY